MRKIIEITKKYIVKLYILIFIVIVTAVTISICTSKPDKSEQSDVKNKLMEFASGSVNSVKEQKIYDNISKEILSLPEEEVEAYSKMFIMGSLNDITDYNTLLSYHIDTIEQLILDYGINDLKYSNFKNIKDSSKISAALGLIEEIESKNFQLFRDANTSELMVKINIDKFLKDYGEFISDDDKEFLKFVDYESTKKAINSEGIPLIEEVAQRLIMIENNLNSSKKNPSETTLKWLELNTLYYGILFDIEGVNVSQGKYTTEYIESLKKIQNSSKDSLLYKNIQEFLKILEKNKNEFKLEEQDIITNIHLKILEDKEIKEYLDSTVINE